MLQQVQGIASERRVPRWLWLLVLLGGVLMAMQTLSYVFLASGYAVPSGTMGFGQLLPDCDADRFCSADVIHPGYPAAQAGIRQGNRIRLDRYWERSRLQNVGTTVGLTVRHEGRDRHLELVTVTSPAFFAPTYIISGITLFVVCLIALLILSRAGRRWPVFLLGLALIGYAEPGNYPRFWQNDPTLFPFFFVMLSLVISLAPVWMLFALRGFRRQVTGRVPRWLDHLTLAAMVGELVVCAWAMIVELNAMPLLGVSDGLSFLSLAVSFGAVLAPLTLAAGWREVPPESRTRYAFMWAAVSAVSFSFIIDPVIMLTGNDYVDASWPVLIQLTAVMLSAILFAYAILRHRVVDLGFAINRTLVFSTLSFLTLAAFGLVEWGTENLLPIKSHEENVVIDAAVALLLFVAFHHVHVWVENAVESVFFHQWQVNEKALERFVRQVSYMTRSETLIERTVAEVSRFAGGSEAAFYRLSDGNYRLMEGGLSARSALLDMDEPALITLRAERMPVRDTFMPGSLILPMVHRAEVTGFVAIGAKPNGEPYRIDEEEKLADAVRRIGLDLYALRVEELEQLNARLSAQLGLVAA
jgi:hypothetical protein